MSHADDARTAESPPGTFAQPNVKGRARRLVVAAISIAGLLAWGWFDVRERARLDTSRRSNHRSDISVYLEASRAMYEGGDPYSVTNVRGWTYLYPPLFALLLRPMTGMQVQNAAFVWYLASLLLAAGCVAECRGIARLAWTHWTGRDPGRFGFGAPDASRSASRAAAIDARLPGILGLLAFGAALLPGLNCLQRGQVGFAVLYPLMLGLRMLCQAVDHSGAARDDERAGGVGKRSFWGGFWMALPIAIKITPALVPAAAGCWMALRLWRQRSESSRGGESSSDRRDRDRRAAVPFVSCLAGLLVGVAGSFLLIPASLIGWDANIRHLGRWYAEVARSDDLGLREGIVRHSARNQSLENAAFHFVNACARLAGAGESAFDEAKRISTTVAFPVSPDLIRGPARGASIVLLVMLLLCVARTPVGHAAIDLAAVAALACVVSLAVSPISWGHHFILLMPGVFFITLKVAPNTPRLAVAMAVAPLVLILLHYAWLDMAGYIGLLGLGMTAWCVAAMWMLARSGWVDLAPPLVPNK